MKVTELRIGSIVCPIGRSSEIHMPATLIHLKVMRISPFEVEAIPLGNHPYTMPEWPKYSLIDLSGIPFTEEWRLKAGLERDRWLFLKDEQVIEWRGDGVMISGPDAVTSGHCFFAKCEYVHQFQNLIYALTGTELTFDK